MRFGQASKCLWQLIWHSTSTAHQEIYSQKQDLGPVQSPERIINTEMATRLVPAAACCTACLLLLGHKHLIMRANRLQAKRLRSARPSQNDCSTSTTRRKRLKEWHALTENHKLQRTTAQALTCSGRNTDPWQKCVLQMQTFINLSSMGRDEHPPRGYPTSISAPGCRRWVSGTWPH